MAPERTKTCDEACSSQVGISSRFDLPSKQAEPGANKKETDMESLTAMAGTLGAMLKERDYTVAVAESSAGG